MPNSDKKSGFEFFESGTRYERIAPIVALIGSLLFHVVLLLAIPYEIDFVKPEERAEELQLEVIPPELEEMKKIPDYIEANPLANQNEPEKNAAESFQNQRAAEELPDVESKSRRPYVEGEVKEGNKVVSGTNKEAEVSPQEVMDVLNRPLEQQSPMYMQGQAVSQSAQQKAAKAGSQAGGSAPSSVADFAKESAEDKNSESKKSDEDGQKKGLEKIDVAEGERSAPSEEAPLEMKDASPSDEAKSPKSESETQIEVSEAARKSEKSENVEERKTSGKKRAEQTNSDGKSSGKTGNASGDGNVSGNAPQNAEEIPEPLPQPKPRPQLSMRTPQGPLSDFRMRASERGTIAVDSRFSEFGAYQQRMIEAISRQWNLLASQFNLTGTVNTHVIVEYTLNTKGELTRIEVLFSNSSHTGRGLCEQSILSTAPYGEWSKEMITTLGAQDQSVRITFYYR